MFLFFQLVSFTPSWMSERRMLLPWRGWAASHNPRVITIANAVFGSKPPINAHVLTKAFQVDKNVVNYLQKQFWWVSAQLTNWRINICKSSSTPPPGTSHTENYVNFSLLLILIKLTLYCSFWHICLIKLNNYVFLSIKCIN